MIRSLKLKSLTVKKQLGPTWENTSTCISNMDGKSCGPGVVTQVRSCIDGTFEKCTLGDRQQNVSCLDAGMEQDDCDRVLGDWINIGNCSAVGSDKGCGPGTVVQERTCEDGTNLFCRDVELRNEAVNCEDAGNPLPPCQKILGIWKTKGGCNSIVKGCGPGTATQIRDCTNGTIDKCSDDDMEKTVTCKTAGIEQANCTGNSIS